MEDKKNIFRQTSLEQMSSPEKLNDYIKVSNPAVWLILGAIGALLIAAAVWACTYELTVDGLRPIDFLLGNTNG
jgi:hypothetical protein